MEPIQIERNNKTTTESIETPFREIAERIFYHTTLVENRESIFEKGLIPQIGERSIQIETEEAVWLFNSVEDLDNALMNWLGEEIEETYGEDAEMVTFKITLPADFPVEGEEGMFERFTRQRIPPEYIEFFRED